MCVDRYTCLVWSHLLHWLRPSQRKCILHYPDVCVVDFFLSMMMFVGMYRHSIRQKNMSYGGTAQFAARRPTRALCQHWRILRSLNLKHLVDITCFRSEGSISSQKKKKTKMKHIWFRVPGCCASGSESCFQSATFLIMVVIETKSACYFLCEIK